MCIVFYFIYCFFSGHKWGSSLYLNSGEHRRLLNLPSGKTSRLTSSRRRCLKRESVKISRKEKLQNRYIDHSCNSVLITIYQLQVSTKNTDKLQAIVDFCSKPSENHQHPGHEGRYPVLAFLYVEKVTVFQES